jgi:hypothetical protein
MNKENHWTFSRLLSLSLSLQKASNEFVTIVDTQDLHFMRHQRRQYLAENPDASIKDIANFRPDATSPEGFIILRLSFSISLFLYFSSLFSYPHSSSRIGFHSSFWLHSGGITIWAHPSDRSLWRSRTQTRSRAVLLWAPAATDAVVW